MSGILGKFVRGQKARVMDSIRAPWCIPFGAGTPHFWRSRKILIAKRHRIDRHIEV
jgi:hypothetical protein